MSALASSCRLAARLSITVTLTGLCPFAGSTEAWRQKNPPIESLIAIYAPEKELFELALDELDLDWSRTGLAKGAAQPAPAAAAGARLDTRDGHRATFSVSSVATREQLAAIGGALEDANPGAEVNLILYDAGAPRTAATRRMLTREVAIVFQDPQATELLSQFAANKPRPIAGVPGGYLLEAADPVQALYLAEELRGDATVKNAYPLIKRQQFAR